METFFNILQRYGNVYMDGLMGTLWLAAVTVIFGTAIGTILAMMRLSRFKAPGEFVRLYVWMLRGTPHTPSALLLLDLPAQSPAL